MSVAPSPRAPERSHLHEGWVIANHILVSFHVAFISSVLVLPSAAVHKAEVLSFIFLSPETLVSALFLYLSFHAGIAFHEIGHFRAAVRLNALNPAILEEVAPHLRGSFGTRARFFAGLFLRTPYGKARGIKREGLNYYPDAPYNLAVAAAGPRASRDLALATLPAAGVLLAVGLALDLIPAVYVGRLLLGLGVVGLLDFFIADPGKYREFRERERRATEQAAAVGNLGSWFDRAPAVKKRMMEGRIQEITHPTFGPVTAPWQFRNCGMGGRHTEKEYPESNISMQEGMFLILSARDYQDAQEMTVRLQTRLKEIIEKAEGGRVMGIGLEGGLAPYIEKESYPLPEVRLWAMMKQTIEECGFRPGQDVAIALDPAMSELEKAYRDEFNVPDSVGMYLFWRDKAKTVLDRDGVMEIYRKALTEYEIPIASIEDGFSEDDREGWKLLLEELGDRILVIGDDLVTTNDRTIEQDAARGLINTALIKANQIGSLYETLIAMLVALGKGLEIVVSHRSKSPNDDMEAHIALAVNALGLKAGGGANTERLVKYQSVAEMMGRGGTGGDGHALTAGRGAVFDSLIAYEEPTNAGIPTVGATVEIALPESGVNLRFRGATPLGTSAGTGEAIHLVDALVEQAEHRELIERHGDLFVEVEPGLSRFRSEIRDADVRARSDEALLALYQRARRYGGKGCISAVENVLEVIAPVFEGRSAVAMTVRNVDRALLRLEARVGRRRGKLADDASLDERVHVMQRKQNLGMNALLAVSLALARGLAHIKGQHLYELLRDEMIALIAGLCERERVPIQGSRLSDYMTALRTATRGLESRGKPLYEALREVSRIYEIDAPADGESEELSSVGEQSPREEAATTDVPSSPVSTEVPATAELEPLTERESEGLENLSRTLHRAFIAHPNEANRAECIRQYLSLKRPLGSRRGAFGFVNNRMFRHGDHLAIPYMLGNHVLIHGVRDGDVQELGRRFVAPGAVLTDGFLRQAGDITNGEVVDLEPIMFDFREEDVEIPTVARLRDIAAALAKINESVNRTQGVFALRCLAARLVSLSFRAFFAAKNMQPEVRNLNVELDRFLNGPLARRVPLLVRILMRNIAGLATKPTVIDRLWNDTIDLAEIHVRGSAIVNELRRRTHHALGTGTLRLARAYAAYLETGETAGLVQEGFRSPGPADESARSRRPPRELVERIVGDLETFLEAGDVFDRLHDWKERYSDALVRCEFGKRLDEETESVADALRQRNRFVYQHHLRILKTKVDTFSAGPGIEACGRELAELLELDPGNPSQDLDAAEGRLRSCEGRLESLLQEIFEAELYARLDSALDTYRRGDLLGSAEAIRETRQLLRPGPGPAAFPEQRRHLFHLDCLLEEMSYLTLRRVASRYEDEGVVLRECLGTVRACVRNLEPDGVPCQELRDLTDAVVDDTRTFAEVLDLLEGIQRCFHEMLQRVITPFEVIRERLGMSPDELQLVTANLRRGLFDLNAMVQFAELANRHIRDHVDDLFKPVNGGTAPESSSEAAALDFLHISHRDEIRRRVESPDPRDCLRTRYGGKGSSLFYISHLNLPTRDGFVVPTLLPRLGLHETRRTEFEGALEEHLAILEEDLHRRDGTTVRFGNADQPLLLAVRGGSVLSLPGILTTVVFVGMNDRITQALAANDPWHAYDSYRRFLASLAAAVWRLDLENYDLVDETKRRYGVRSKDDLPWEGMREVVEASKTAIRQCGHARELDALLEDPRRQLFAAVQAVLGSWDRESAWRYRDIKRISHGWHTAVIVQEMASGNRTNTRVASGMDETTASLTGVIPHTRLTNWGVRELEGEFKFSAAGDDLVGGMIGPGSFRPIGELESLMPMLYRRLRHVVGRLRRFQGTDQEIEFTVDRGVLSILQSRTSQRSTEDEVVAFVDPGPPDAQGIGVRGYAFRGAVAFDEEDQKRLIAAGFADRDDVDGVLMVMENPTPDDIPMILSADGLLAAKGGATSHAAVAVNSVRGKPLRAVMSAAGLRVNGSRHEAVVEDVSGEVLHRLTTGDIVSLHGTTGQVYVGSRAITRPDRAPAATRPDTSPAATGSPA